MFILGSDGQGSFLIDIRQNPKAPFPAWTKSSNAPSGIQSCAAAPTDWGMWVFAADANGQVWVAALKATGSLGPWSALSDPGPPTPGPVDSLAAGVTATASWLCAIDTTGSPWIRASENQELSQWMNVSSMGGQTVRNLRSFVCAGTGEGLELVATDANQAMWHAVVDIDGPHSTWTDITSASKRSFTSEIVSCASTAAGFQLVCLGPGGVPWHTIRGSTGAWQSDWLSVDSQVTGNHGPFDGVAVTGDYPGLPAGDGLHVVGWN